MKMALKTTMTVRRLQVQLFAIACAVLLTAGIAAAQGTAPSGALPKAEAASGLADVKANPDRDYVLGAGDVIEIQVLGRSDFTTRARIAEDGTIQLPYIGAVHAANRTTGQMSEDVGRALEAGGYFSKPIVQVQIVGYASRYVTVLGEVTSPGLVPIDRPYRLSEILARVGGAKEDAADFVTLRSVAGPERRLLIKTLATGDATQDPIVDPGDKIYLPKAQLFYISGQVKSPGAYPLEDGMTLRMAIARAGGLTDLGSDHGVKVTDADGKIRGAQLNDQIHARDVILVGERLF